MNYRRLSRWFDSLAVLRSTDYDIWIGQVHFTLDVLPRADLSHVRVTVAENQCEMLILFFDLLLLSLYDYGTRIRYNNFYIRICVLTSLNLMRSYRLNLQFKSIKIKKLIGQAKRPDIRTWTFLFIGMQISRLVVENCVLDIIKICDAFKLYNQWNVIRASIPGIEPKISRNVSLI